MYKPVIWITAGTTVRAAVIENESKPSDQSEYKNSAVVYIILFRESKFVKEFGQTSCSVCLCYG